MGYEEVLTAAIFVGICVAVGAAPLLLIRVVTNLMGTRHGKVGKYEPYECGVPMIGDTRQRFPIKFYIVALMFVLFDIETVFLLPYAVTFKILPNPVQGFYEVLAFVVVLGGGLAYILCRDALRWD